MDTPKDPIEITTHIGLLTHLPGMHYMFIPAHVIQHFGSGFKKRLIATVNNTIQWQCGLMSLGEGNAYISISKDKMKKAGLENGSTIHLKLEIDDSKYGLPVPEEFNIVIEQDPEAALRFEMLSAGIQRYILTYVGAVKNPDKRIERAILLMRNLVQQQEGQESFREMLGLPRHREL
jgi:hypothetical protein